MSHNTQVHSYEITSALHYLRGKLMCERERDVLLTYPVVSERTVACVHGSFGALCRLQDEVVVDVGHVKPGLQT